MKLKNPLIVVSDIEASKRFYKETLGLRVVMDFGANVTLSGGLCLQTKESWAGFIQAAEDEIAFGGKNFEIYFEEDDFDAFIEKLEQVQSLHYVHPTITHSWGQRAVRFYDPDYHIIEVAENIKTVCRRFLEKGMTPQEVAKRMDVPIKFVNACNR